MIANYISQFTENLNIVLTYEILNDITEKVNHHG